MPQREERSTRVIKGFRPSGSESVGLRTTPLHNGEAFGSAHWPRYMSQLLRRVQPGVKYGGANMQLVLPKPMATMT